LVTLEEDLDYVKAFENTKKVRSVPCNASSIGLLDKDSFDSVKLLTVVVLQLIQVLRMVRDIGIEPKDIGLRVEVESTEVQFRMLHTSELLKGMGPRLVADVK